MYPKISIVTPSYNQGKYLEETIISVLEQNYPNLEYIIIDGGSTDESIEIIKKYEQHISYWVSEKDSGQSCAINKGFRHASGEIFAWIASDDLYERNTLFTVAKAFLENENVGLIYGDYKLLYPDGTIKLKKKISFDYNICFYSFLMIPQPSSFFRSSLYHNVGGVDEKLHYCMDYDLFLRMSKESSFKHLNESLSLFRLHESSKSVAEKNKFEIEEKIIRERILGRELNRIDNVKQKLYLLKAVILFLVERRTLVYKKESGKA